MTRFKSHNTVECRCNAVNFITILPSALRWQQQKLNQTCNRQQTPHTSPTRASYGVSIVRNWETIDCFIKAPHCRLVVNVMSAGFSTRIIVWVRLDIYPMVCDNLRVIWVTVTRHKIIMTRYTITHFCAQHQREINVLLFFIIFVLPNTLISLQSLANGSTCNSHRVSVITIIDMREWFT